MMACHILLYNYSVYIFLQEIKISKCPSNYYPRSLANFFTMTITFAFSYANRKKIKNKIKKFMQINENIVRV